jgi:uncharacterized protein (TIGR02001 family)
MNFKHLAVAAAVSSATFSGAVLAETSVNVGVTSQYLFRGLEQGPGAAVSGGIDYASESGFYVGTWASTIDFAPVAGSAEIDLYAGFGGEAGGMAYDLGLIYYWYPEEDEDAAMAGVPGPDPSLNTIELYGSLGFGPVTLGGYFAPDTYFGIDESAYGINVGLSVPVSEKLSFDAFVGHNGGKGNEALNGGDAYLDFSVGLSAESEAGLSFGLALVATDIDDDDIKPVVSGGYSF